jgi:methane monooxygenase/ammonia monooxygenase subunit A
VRTGFRVLEPVELGPRTFEINNNAREFSRRHSSKGERPMSIVADVARGVARSSNAGNKTSSAAPAGVRQVSRLFDLMVAGAVLIVLTAAYHIHIELTIGDWDFWVDWKDREWWVTFAPVLMITFPAAVQYLLWTNFRLPIGATLCCLGLVLGEWIVRVHGFHMWSWFPYTLIWPATMLPGAIALDCILMLTGNFLFRCLLPTGCRSSTWVRWPRSGT